MASISIKMNLDNDQFQTETSPGLKRQIQNVIENTLKRIDVRKDTVTKIRDENGNSIGVMTYLT